LTFSEAAALREYLETSGNDQRELRLEAGGATVRWRPAWPLAE
jgi:hypothetical protein